MKKVPCGLPPKFPVNSALRAKNDIIEVPDSAVFKCREDGKVTDLGKSIDIQVPAILITFSCTFYATECTLPHLKRLAQIYNQYGFIGNSGIFSRAMINFLKFRRTEQSPSLF